MKNFTISNYEHLENLKKDFNFSDGMRLVNIFKNHSNFSEFCETVYTYLISADVPVNNKDISHMVVRLWQCIPNEPKDYDWTEEELRSFSIFLFKVLPPYGIQLGLISPLKPPGHV